jgi:hypothetical protein
MCTQKRIKALNVVRTRSFSQISTPNLEMAKIQIIRHDVVIWQVRLDVIRVPLVCDPKGASGPFVPEGPKPGVARNGSENRRDADDHPCV